MELITMSETGRLTLPAEARRALGVTGETHFRFELQDGAIVLRPVVTLVVGSRDQWIAQPRHRELLRQALADIDGGRIREARKKDLSTGAKDRAVVRSGNRESSRGVR